MRRLICVNGFWSAISLERCRQQTVRSGEIDVLAWMAVKVLRISEHAEHKAVRLLLLHAEDVWVQARAGPDGLLEQPSELPEAWVVGSVRVPQAAVPANADTSEGRRRSIPTATLNINGDLYCAPFEEPRGIGASVSVLPW